MANSDVQVNLLYLDIMNMTNNYMTVPEVDIYYGNNLASCEEMSQSVICELAD